VPSDSQRAFLERASKRYHENITPDAVAYLKGRGVGEESIDRFQLGVVADPLPGHERYEGMLSIPYLTAYGPVTIRYRRLGGDGEKYLTMPGDTPRIFNPQALQRGTRGICITEGELDCIIAEQCGLPAIAFPGSTSWRKVWLRLLEDYAQVLLLQDDDEAGRAMAERLGKMLPNLRPVVMTGGDVTSFVLQHGEEALKEKVVGR